MKTFRVTPKNPSNYEDIYPVIERDYLRNAIAGFVRSAKEVGEIFKAECQAAILADSLKQQIDIWFGDLVTIEEKEA